MHIWIRWFSLHVITYRTLCKREKYSICYPLNFPPHHEKSKKFTQFFSVAVLLVGHNLLNMRLGWAGRASRPLNLEVLPISSRGTTFASKSSSASFILRVVFFVDFGDLNPETLQLSSAWILVVVLNGAVCFDGSMPWAVSNALMLLGMSVTLPPAAAARACSKKRTCTTTLRGSNSFCAACMQASTDNFLQSRIRHNLFLSFLFSSGCAYIFQLSKIQIWWNSSLVKWTLISCEGLKNICLIFFNPCLMNKQVATETH